ncbi:DUF5320 domain-containing protein [Candidatus Micrarchaeota archaeon]|nr:DUF5320 domain-containing protein [Candidatus Micrarchaeota archaeon]
MPFGDGTGPWWGRGRWMCKRGLGYGRGAGFGWRNYAPEYPGQYPQNTQYSQDELTELKRYSKEIEQELQNIKSKIKELEKK